MDGRHLLLIVDGLSSGVSCSLVVRCKGTRQTPIGCCLVSGSSKVDGGPGRRADQCSMAADNVEVEDLPGTAAFHRHGRCCQLKRAACCSGGGDEPWRLDERPMGGAEQVTPRILARG